MTPQKRNQLNTISTFVFRTLMTLILAGVYNKTVNILEKIDSTQTKVEIHDHRISEIESKVSEVKADLSTNMRKDAEEHSRLFDLILNEN